MNKNWGIALLGIVLGLLVGSVIRAHASESDCINDYYTLDNNLAAMEQIHIDWIYYLQAHPDYPTAFDTPGIEVQQEFVQLYETRRWVLWSVVNGDGTYYDWLQWDFAVSRQNHYNNYLNLNYYGEYSRANDQLGFAQNYDWRIWMLDKIRWEC